MSKHSDNQNKTRFSPKKSLDNNTENYFSKNILTITQTIFYSHYKSLDNYTENGFL